jgi:hypothetical protein
MISTNPVCMNAIKRVEMVSPWWYPSNALLSVRYPQVLNAIIMFHALEQLILLEPDPRLQESHERNRAVEVIRSWFEEKSHECPDFKVPNVALLGSDGLPLVRRTR